MIKTHCRDKLQKWLLKKDIQTQIHYPVPVHLQKCFVNKSNIDFKLTETEKIYKIILSLPNYPEMSRESIEYVIHSVNAFSP